MKNQYHIGLLLSLSVVAMILASACGNDLDTLLQGRNCGPYCSLANANLSGANLSGAILSEANLDNAILEDATGADFSGALNVLDKYLKD